MCSPMDDRQFLALQIEGFMSQLIPFFESFLFAMVSREQRLALSLKVLANRQSAFDKVLCPTGNL